MFFYILLNSSEYLDYVKFVFNDSKLDIEMVI